MHLKTERNDISPEHAFFTFKDEADLIVAHFTITTYNHNVLVKNMPIVRLTNAETTKNGDHHVKLGFDTDLKKLNQTIEMLQAVYDNAVIILANEDVPVSQED